MYIVANGKIYSAVFNEALKVYPELKVVKDSEGKLSLKTLSTGVPAKPHYRQAATLAEVFAQFGSTAEVEDLKPETPAAPKAKTSSTKTQSKK